MHIFPPKIDVSDLEGFDPDKDIFKRAQFGVGLANLVRAVEDPMVIAFDGQWGSGKTTFIKMWAGLLRQNGHPVIYFDAFANDYVDDAFLAIAGEVIALSQENKKKNTPAHQQFLNKAASVGKAILESGAKLGAKAATLGILEEADFEKLKSISEDIASEIGGKADEYIKSLLSRRGEERKNLEGFRSALSGLAKDLAANKSSKNKLEAPGLPLVFIVDELDRCKPPFALDLLEKIKHVFSVPGVHFVLVTHLAQLENFVKLTYGGEIDGTTYLQKFYNLIVHLPGDGRYEHERPTRKYLGYLKQHLAYDDRTLGILERVARARNLSFREIEKIFTYISLAVAFTKSQRFELHPPIVATLCLLKALVPPLFQKAKRGSLTIGEVLDALGFSNWPDDQEKEWVRKSWQFALDPSLDLTSPEWQNWAQGMGFMRSERLDTVRYTAESIIDRMQIT